MAPSDWYYAKGNRQLGPVSSTELKQLAESGQLVADDLVWREGMVEWISANKVKGLFAAPVEEPARVESPPEHSPPVESPPVQSPPAGGAWTGIAPAPREPTSIGPQRHPFDMLIDLIRRQFPPQFVDSSSRVFSVVGYYGLYVGMAMLLVHALVVGIKTEELPMALAMGGAWVLVLIVLQYASGKFLVSLDKLNRSTSGRMSSTALPDCFALLSMCAGLAALVGLVIVALAAGDFSIIMSAIGLFILCEYVAILSLTLGALNIHVESDASAGEEAIGILSFLAKLILRVVPVAFGLGVALGICDLIISSALIASDSGLRAEMVEMTGAVMTMLASGYRLATSAAMPIVAYVYFLIAYLSVDVLNSILKLPRLLKKDNNEEGQT